MLARLKSEIAYARGILPRLERTRPIAENRGLTLGDYLDAGPNLGDRPALLSERRRSPIASSTRAPIATRAGRGRKGSARATRSPDDGEPPEYSRSGSASRARGGDGADQHQSGRPLARPIASSAAKAAIVDAADAGLRNRPAAGGGGLAVFAHGVAATGDARLDHRGRGVAGRSRSGERPALTIDEAALFI